MNRKASWTVSKFGLLLALGLLLGLVIGTSAAFSAVPPHPTYGTATVDGDDSEWLAGDWFAHMYRAGKATKEIESDLYLRYDCSTNTLYALVLAVGGPITDVNKPDEHWIKLDGAKKTAVNADSPNFEWVGLSVTTDTATAQGWEASVPLAEGPHTLNVHTNVWDDGESQTSATPKIGIDLDIICTCVGDFVWSDENKDGVQGGLEGGFFNVVMELHEDLGTVGSYEPVTDTLVITTTTNISGNYLFSGLQAGNYIVKVADSNFDPGGALFAIPPITATVPFSGTNTAIDSNGSGVSDHFAAVTLTTGQCDTTIDFGFHVVAGQTAITLSFFRSELVDAGQGKVYFEWWTETELDNFGFNLYVEGRSDPLNEVPILSLASDPMTPTYYEYTAYGVSGNLFFLQDVELDGDPHMNGPFELGKAYPPEPWPSN